MIFSKPGAYGNNCIVTMYGVCSISKNAVAKTAMRPAVRRKQKQCVGAGWCPVKSGVFGGGGGMLGPLSL